MTSRKKVAIFISGRGSNMERLLRECGKDPEIEFRLVFSNKPDAPGLSVAESFGVETLSFTKKECGSAEEFDTRLIAELRQREIDLVCLAGFMAIVSKRFVDEFPNRIVNIHPSLLPSFPGLHAQRQAIEAGVKLAGCTVHFVNEKVDDGAIVLQRAVNVSDDDTEESLSEKILREEHQAYPEALRLICRGEIVVVGKHARRRTQ